MIRVGKLSLLLTAALFLSACGFEAGNHHVVEEQRAVPAFSKVAIHDGFEVQIGRGERALSITADENLLPFIESYVDGDTLVVEVRRGMLLHPTHGLRATVANDVLTGLDVSGGSRVSAIASAAPEWTVVASGGSDVAVSSLSAGQFIADASGGSIIRASGAAESGYAIGSGASRLFLASAPVGSLVVDASGGSIVEVRASSAVDGQASGGSQVTVWGNPSNLHLSTSGGSRVRREMD